MDFPRYIPQHKALINGALRFASVGTYQIAGWFAQAMLRPILPIWQRLAFGPLFQERRPHPELINFVHLRRGPV